MPAHLDPISLGPDVVGVMDHPVRQPQQALFDGFEMGFDHEASIHAEYQHSTININQSQGENLAFAANISVKFVNHEDFRR